MAKKKVETLPLSLNEKYSMIDPDEELAIMLQCRLLSIAKGSYYRYKNAKKTTSDQAKKLQLKKENDEALKKEIIQMFALDPSLGTRKMTADLRRYGFRVNRKRVKRIMRECNLMSTAPGPYTSTPRKENKIYPYLLRDVLIEASDEVWSTDITYVKVGTGFMYVTAVIDWFSRFVISWDVSNTLDVNAPIRALDKALATGRKPLIFNTDQGSQFTSTLFTERLLTEGIYISMDSKGRAVDNIFIERFWRSLKYEWLHLWVFEDGHQLHHAVAEYIERYNHKRSHQSLQYLTPAEVYLNGISAPAVFIKWKYQKELKTVTQVCEVLVLASVNEDLKKERELNIINKSIECLVN